MVKFITAIPPNTVLRDLKNQYNTLLVEFKKIKEKLEQVSAEIRNYDQCDLYEDVEPISTENLDYSIHVSNLPYTNSFGSPDIDYATNEEAKTEIAYFDNIEDEDGRYSYAKEWFTYWVNRGADFVF